MTSQATIAEDAHAGAVIVARTGGCIAGLATALHAFRVADESLRTSAFISAGAVVDAGTQLGSVRGRTHAILSAERVALNILGHLSGVATATRAFVDAVVGTGATIVDTRKTTPGLRLLEKRAVRAGGGQNHRMGLFDAVLIKDNHVQSVGSPGAAVRRARSHVGDTVKVEVEIDDLADLESVIEAGADIVLLDNMDPQTIRAAVHHAAGRCVLEASGGITLETVRAVAETGVDHISVGWITHSAPALDVALDFVVDLSAPGRTEG